MNSRTASHLGRVLASILVGTFVGSVRTFAQTPTAIATPPAAAVARSTMPNDIRDIRGPEPIASAWLWAMGLAGGVLVAAGGYGAYRWVRRRKNIEKLPYELALERLQEARALMRPDTVRDYSIVVSEHRSALHRGALLRHGYASDDGGISARSAEPIECIAHSSSRLAGRISQSLRPRQIRRLEAFRPRHGKHAPERPQLRIHHWQARIDPGGA